VDSCRECESCKEGLEQYCAGHIVRVLLPHHRR
jgi:D-arabinose 1-dehydrogenase-like Zn-dependent alcohol dehydrogenase